MAIRSRGGRDKAPAGTCSPGSRALPIKASQLTPLASKSGKPTRGVAPSSRARRHCCRAAASAAVTKTPSQPARSAQGSGSLANGASRSPITVMLRSPARSTKLTPRRVGASRQATSRSRPSSVSRSAERSPVASRPREVKNRTRLPLRRASCTATTAPPPAGSSRKAVARSIEPATGSWSTATKLTHST